MLSTDRPILLVANSSWNLSHFRGGLIRSLQKRGFRVEAVVPTGESDVQGVRTHHFPLSAASLAPLTELRSILGLIRLFRQVRPAAVLSFTPKGNIYAGLAARATGTAYLPNISGLGTAFLRGGLLLKVQAALYREALRDAPIVFFQNEEDAALFKRMDLVQPGQAKLLPGSGVDLQHFRAGKLPARSSGQAHLLFVGRLLGDKGVRELAAAMRMLKPVHPDLSLTLVGKLGPANRTAISSQELEGWIAEGLLTHAGHISDVRPLLRQADAVVLPSYREGMPRSLLEAAATGRPLLAADVPGCRQLVMDGENGFLFQARSVESLAAAIERFLALSPGERQAIGTAARRMAEQRYDEKIVFRAYDDALIALKEMSR